MNKITPILIMLCLLSLAGCASATFLGFESGLDGFTDGSRNSTVAHNGSYSMNPHYTSTSTIAISLTNNTQVSFWIYLPTGSYEDRMEVYLMDGIRKYAFNEGYPTSGYYGTLNNNAWSNTGYAVDKGSWHKLAFQYNHVNDTTLLLDNTVIASNKTGAASTDSASIQFYASGVYNIDDIQIGPVLMPLIFEAHGNGQFYAMRNGFEQAVATNNTPVTVNYSIGDSIAFYTVAYASNHLVNVCDYPQTECDPYDWYTYTVIGQLPQKMIATFAVDVGTPTPAPTASPSPTATPAPTLNYSVSALIDGTNLITTTCAGANRGYFYMVAPNSQNKYATYVNEYSCTNFSISLSDMIATGGAGNWTLAIFDESDLSYSKAYYQVLISNGTVLLFTSNPSGAKVYVNSSYKGITPVNLNAGNQTYFHFKFNKTGYVDAIFDSHITSSNTVNANLAEIQGTTTPSPTASPGSPETSDNAAKGFFDWIFTSLSGDIGILTIPFWLGLPISAVLIGLSYAHGDTPIKAKVYSCIVLFTCIGLGLIAWWIVQMVLGLALIVAVIWLLSKALGRGNND